MEPGQDSRNIAEEEYRVAFHTTFSQPYGWRMGEAGQVSKMCTESSPEGVTGKRRDATHVNV